MAMSQIDSSLVTDLMSAFFQLPDGKKEFLLGIAVGLGLENGAPDPIRANREKEKARKGQKG